MSGGGDRDPADLHRDLDAIWSNPKRGLARLTIVNHTVVGQRFMLTGLFFFLVGGVLAMLIRAQLATSGNDFVGHEAYNQIFTMHGTVMMFLFAIPMLEGFGLYLIPKLLGARDLAFPRLSAFGYFCYLFGGLIVLGSLLFGVAPDGGWFMYTPLSSREFTPGINADIWLIGITFVEVSAIGIGVELCATILKVRTGGMSLQKMPLFAWYMLVTALMIVFGFPPLILGSILLELERAFDWPFFDIARGGDSLLWQHLFWLFGHPEVYIIFLPAAGMVSMIVPAVAQRPIVGYTMVVVAVITVGFISFGLWVHHMFTVGIPHLALVFFSAASMLVAVPTAVQFFAWIATLWRGQRPAITLPLLYLFGFLVIFVFGGLTGVMLALVPFNWQAHDTHFVVAHLHYVLVGGFVFPLLAATYYWLPHMTGRMPSQRLGQAAFWLIFIGFNATFFIMHFTGLMGMPRRVYTYRPEFGWDLFNLISSIGGFVMSAGFALFLVDIVGQVRFGRPAERNPWKAGTLEWATATPPAAYNFASLPHVDGREPLWDDPRLAGETGRGEHYLGTARYGWQETLGVDAVTGRPTQIIVLPARSWLPLVSAVAMAVFFGSFLAGLYALAAVGAVAAAVTFVMWGWAHGLKDDPEPLDAGRGLMLLPHWATGDAPGRWGMAFTHAANGTLLASLLFGYFFLWAVAPGWPPPAFLDASPALPGLALAGAVGGWLAARRAGAANAADGPGGATAWLVASIAAGLLGAGAFLAVPVTGLGSPTTHAYNAVVTVMAGYAAFHCAVGAIIAGFALARCRAGYVSRVRVLDLHIHQLWWAYVAAAGIVIVAALFAFPPLVAS